MHESSPIDLRSDTVTRPHSRDAQAIANAEVGDEVLDVTRPFCAGEEKIRGQPGQTGGVLSPTGTMANQTAIPCSHRAGR